MFHRWQAFTRLTWQSSSVASSRFGWDVPSYPCSYNTHTPIIIFNTCDQNDLLLPLPSGLWLSEVSAYTFHIFHSEKLTILPSTWEASNGHFLSENEVTERFCDSRQYTNESRVCSHYFSTLLIPCVVLLLLQCSPLRSFSVCTYVSSPQSHLFFLALFVSKMLLCTVVTMSLWLF